MYLLFKITSNDLIFLVLAGIGLILLGIVTVYVIRKNNRVKPIDEFERFDEDYDDMESEAPREFTEEQQQAKEELERVFNMMNADLEAKKPMSAIDEFEREQEANAIISYQELIRQAREKGQISEDFVIEEKCDDSYKQQDDIEDDSKKNINEDKKFKKSEIISPVFGVQGSSSYQKKQIKQTKELADENSEFLNTLKEFRDNL